MKFEVITDFESHLHSNDQTFNDIDEGNARYRRNQYESSQAGILMGKD